MIGRIYKITSINTDKIYIGSTSKSLTERLERHEYNYKAFQNGKTNNVKSFEILEKENYEIQLLEEIEYDAKTELLEREGYYIKKHRDICVNKYIAGRTDKQYKKDNAQYINQKLECVCGGRFTRSNKICHEKSKKHIAFNKQ